METLLENVTPFMSQIASWPVALLRHILSDLPSQSKSPTPAMLQLTSASVGMSPPPESPVPFTSQMAFSPVTRLRHRMSDLPFPSKSPIPAMLQLRSPTVGI